MSWSWIPLNRIKMVNMILWDPVPLDSHEDNGLMPYGLTGNPHAQAQVYQHKQEKTGRPHQWCGTYTHFCPKFLFF